MKNLVILFCILITAIQCSPPTPARQGFSFSVSFPAELSATPQDGRIILLLASNDKTEPRQQFNFGLNTQLGFGLDVDGMKPGEDIVMNENAFGFPVRKIADIPPGEYYIQAVINRYETFNLKSGKTVKLPPDQGEGQHWNQKPGNFYSRPFKVKIEAGQKEPIKIVMDQIIPPVSTPADTKYVKHIKIQSKMLSEFWGRPMYLGAHVLLPEG
ncbi:MAG: hypothetical protein JNK10_15580, partial [Cyclobacteriaceae bacterium]|nr:hypothetical protein [Cyclobacteriaceae bacterium]